jgi:excisionase family DNA binding protein
MAVNTPDTSLDEALNLITVPDLAQRLQLNPITIRRWIKSGRLPAQKLGKSYRVRVADVLKLVTPEASAQ